MKEGPCIYKKVSGSKISFLVLCADDILLIANDIGMLTSIKAYVSSTFSMTDLGEATYILGICIYKDKMNRMIELSQALFLGKVLKRFVIGNSKKGLPLVRHEVHLFKSMSPPGKDDRKEMSMVSYASAVGHCVRS